VCFFFFFFLSLWWVLVWWVFFSFPPSFNIRNNPERSLLQFGHPRGSSQMFRTVVLCEVLIVLNLFLGSTSFPRFLLFPPWAGLHVKLPLHAFVSLVKPWAPFRCLKGSEGGEKHFLFLSSSICVLFRNRLKTFDHPPEFFLFPSALTLRGRPTSMQSSPTTNDSV